MPLYRNSSAKFERNASAAPSMNKIAFYNCKIGSAKGVTIEIAWASIEQSGEVFSESHFIKPRSNWEIRHSWDQGLRSGGITLDEVMAESASPRWIAERMNGHLEGYELYSGSTFDEFCLDMIFNDTDLMKRFRVRRLGAFAFIKGVALSTGRSKALENVISVMQTRRSHHAEWDAMLLAQLYRLALG